MAVSWNDIDKDMTSLEDYNAKPIRKPVGRVWFLNGDLVRVYHRNRGDGIITVYNIIQDKLQTVLTAEWVKKRGHAYNMKKVAALVNRNASYLTNLVTNGVLPPPLGCQAGGERAFRVRSYYSEEDVFMIREILSHRSWGSPRKDGLITNNHTPTLQEMRRRMGHEMLQYTKDENGKIVPIWSETV